MVQRASISLATGPAVIPTNDVSSGMALFLAPRAWRGPTRYVFIPRCRGLCERILKRRYKAAADRRLRCATRCRSQRNRNRESADCADPRFRATECRDGGGVLRRIRGLPLRRRSQAAGQGKGSAGGHCRVRCEFSRRPLPLPPWRDPACGRKRLSLSWRDILNLGLRQDPTAKVGLRKFGVFRSTFRPRISDSSCSKEKNLSPGTCPDSNSTRTSTSLSGRKSSRRTDPKSASLRMWFRRQNPASLFRSIAIRLLSTVQSSFLDR